jgi:DNA-binding SARP family transcriptional activator
LLAYLALRPGQTCSREGLTALLWGDTDAQQARNSFRVTLFDVRRALRSAKLAFPPSRTTRSPSTPRRSTWMC